MTKKLPTRSRARASAADAGEEARAAIDVFDGSKEDVAEAHVAKATTKSSPIIMGVIVIVLAAAVILGVKNLFQPKPLPVPVPEASSGSQTPSSQQPSLPANDIQSLVQKVARHIAVKADEAPTVATVQDADLLRKQNPTFYKDATNGDRLIIWSDKAVLYSSAEDKVLSVIPLNLVRMPAGTTSTQVTPPEDELAPGTTMSEKAKVEVRNGSGVNGLGKTVAEKVKTGGLLVLPAISATAKVPYEKTVIFVRDASKPMPATVATLRNILGAELVSPIPEEVGIKGDVVVVVGKDYQK